MKVTNYKPQKRGREGKPQQNKAPKVNGREKKTGQRTGKTKPGAGQVPRGNPEKDAAHSVTDIRQGISVEARSPTVDTRQGTRGDKIAVTKHLKTLRLGKTLFAREPFQQVLPARGFDFSEKLFNLLVDRGLQDLLLQPQPARGEEKRVRARSRSARRFVAVERRATNSVRMGECHSVDVEVMSRRQGRKNGQIGSP